MRSLSAMLLVGLPLLAADPPPTALADYVAKADQSFAWKLKDTATSNGHTVYTLSLTSQTWQGLDWTHDLQVFVPKGAMPRGTMVLWNQGGKAGATEAALGTLLADRIGAPVAFLYGVPNQPLYPDSKTGGLTFTPSDPADPKKGRLTEDALIAATFVKYLDTKDETWPLLLPMVKSVTRAMDALQEFATTELKAEVKDFVVTGASKRGWTSWLTAASGDKRVKAIAPLVIDTLDFPRQMQNQIAAFGKPSEMIADYTAAKLVPIPDTPEGTKLWKMVDPHVYREKLTLPKMLIMGSNDPYWPQDALNSYWDDLKGQKHVLYVPNAGHDLREYDKSGKPELLPTRAVSTLSAFCRSQVFDTKMPRFGWKLTNDGVEVEWDDPPRLCRVWTADAETKDFRKARWTNSTVELITRFEKLPTTNVKPEVPTTGYRATFVEAEYATDAGPIYLSTQILIREAKKK